jgi:hypothetical protein
MLVLMTIVCISELRRMAKVQLCNVVVLDNPAPFLNPFQFELTFECLEELKEGTYMQYIFIPSVCSKINKFIQISIFIDLVIFPVCKSSRMYSEAISTKNYRRIINITFNNKFFLLGIISSR